MSSLKGAEGEYEERKELSREALGLRRSKVM